MVVWKRYNKFKTKEREKFTPLQGKYGNFFTLFKFYEIGSWTVNVVLKSKSQESLLQCCQQLSSHAFCIYRTYIFSQDKDNKTTKCFFKNHTLSCLRYILDSINQNLWLHYHRNICFSNYYYTRLKLQAFTFVKDVCSDCCVIYAKLAKLK